MILDQRLTVLDFVQLRDLGVVAVVLAVALAGQQLADGISECGDVVGISLNDQRAALRVDGVGDGDEEENLLRVLDRSQESIGEVDLDAVVLVEREVLASVGIGVQLLGSLRRDILRQSLNRLLRRLQSRLQLLHQLQVQVGSIAVDTTRLDKKIKFAIVSTHFNKAVN